MKTIKISYQKRSNDKKLFAMTLHEASCFFVGRILELLADGSCLVFVFLAGSNLQVRIKPVIFSRFSQPAHFFRFKPDHLLLNRARFSGYNLCYNLTFLAGLNLQVQTWINIQVSADNPILHA